MNRRTSRRSLQTQCGCARAQCLSLSNLGPGASQALRRSRRKYHNKINDRSEILADITNYASNSNVHVLRGLPELLLLAVAVARWDLVKEVHDSLHHVSSHHRYP
jgi:hypothetical protein